MKKVISSVKNHLSKIKEGYALDPAKKAKHRAVFFTVLDSILAIGLILVIVFMATYGERALPGTYLAGTEVSSQTLAKLESSAKSRFKKIDLTITSGDVVVKINPEDIGLTLDAKATAKAVLESGNKYNLISKFNPLRRKDNVLIFKYDISAIQNYFNEKFFDIAEPPTEPELFYNDTTGVFEVIPGKSGQIVSARDLVPILNDLAANPRKLTKSIKVSDVKQIVSDSNAGETRDYVNTRLPLRINMLHQGRLMYFIDPWDIASFMEFTPDPDTGRFVITYSDERIKTFIDEKLVPTLSSAPVNEKLLVDKEGNLLMVITKGRNGLAPNNVDYLVDKIKMALIDNEPLDVEMNLTESPYKTEKITTEDARWIEYNLSTFTLTLWDGLTEVWSTNNTANGKASTPTITGSFRVYAKVSSQTMTGGTPGTADYYNIPGVTWVTYWGAGGYAFHTASWLGGQERTRISHGCVNMHEADAKIVYNYASIGTLVVVHW